MAKNTVMQDIDFGYMTMDEIKVMAVKDRLKKFEGNATRAAASLEIHPNSISNILNQNEAKPDSHATVETKKQNDQSDKLGREGWEKSDPKTGASVPTALTPVPGIDKIAEETFAKAKERNQQREKESAALSTGPGRTTVSDPPAGKGPKKGK